MNRRITEHVAARRGDLACMWPAIIQTTAAAAAAWVVGQDILGHPSPFFAPIAAIVTLALSFGGRIERAGEVTGGVCLGVLVGWPCLELLGRGTVRAILVAVASAMFLAVLLSGRRLVLIQAATSAVLMVSVSTPPGTLATARVADAVTGGLTGVLVGVILFPISPQRLARRGRARLVRALVATLEALARALTDRDIGAAAAATRSSHALNTLAAAYADHVDVGVQIARGSLRHRIAPTRSSVPKERDATGLGLVVQGIQALSRTAQRVVENRATASAEAVRAMALLVLACRLLDDPSGTGAASARTAALRASSAADHARLSTDDLYVATMLAQVRTVAAEMLQAAGESEESAIHAIHAAGDPVGWPSGCV